MGYKMTKIGHCNFGAPQLKIFLKKVLVAKKTNVLRPWKKIAVPGTFKPPKVEKCVFFRK